MELENVWLWYCAERLGQPTEQPAMEPLGPAEVLDLFWTFHAVFRPRHDAIAATPYSEAFDEEADGALAQLAIADSFAGWEAMSAGAWRVLYERFAYSCTVAMANEVEGTEVIASLPVGLDDRSRARALLLRFLLGGGRSIDRRLLARSKPGALPPFPASTPLRRQ